VPAAFGLAAAGLLVLGGAIILRSGTDEVTTIDDAEAPTPAVFEGVDCDWFTPDELNAGIDRAQAIAGTDFAFERFEDETMCVSTREHHPSYGLDEWISGARWYTTEPEYTIEWPPEGAIDLRIETTDLPLPDEAWERLGYRAHPMLDESVHYQFPKSINPANQYESGESVEANLLIGGRPLVVFSLRIGDAEVREDPSPKYETVAFAIANEMLREMGWIG